MLLFFPIPLPPRPSKEEKGSNFPFSLVSHGQEMNSLRDMLCRVRSGFVYLLTDFVFPYSNLPQLPISHFFWLSLSTIKNIFCRLLCCQETTHALHENNHSLANPPP